MVPFLYPVLTSVSLSLSVFSPVVGHYCFCSKKKKKKTKKKKTSSDSCSLCQQGWEALACRTPASDADVSYLWSGNVTKALVDRILRRRDRPMAEVVEVQRDAFKANQRSKARRLDELSSVTKEQLPPRMKRAVIAAEEKGSSSWLTALPLADFGFSLSKGECQDALNLRYGWTPPRLPSLCVCGDSFNIDHALSCSHGGYLGLRHNEVRDLLGELLDETCSNVCLEPVLKPINGEQLRRSPTPQTTQGWISRLEDSGVETDMSAHILTSGCFTLMRAHIATAPWSNSTDHTNRTNAVTMKIVLEMWRGAPSHLWCSLPLEVPAPRLRRFSSGWLTRWPRRGTAAMHRPWVGFGAACLLHSFGRACSA